MTNKQKALLRVAGVLGVATAVPLVIISVLNALAEYFNPAQIVTGFGIVCMSYLIITLSRYLYENELDKLNRLDQLNKGE